MSPIQQPVSVLFDPDRSLKESEAVRTVAVPVLDTMLRYGLGVLSRCSDEEGCGDDKLAILIAYRHVLEMLDAVAILVGAAAPIPARLQLRSMFEGLLTVEYMISAPSSTDRLRRCYAYLVCDAHRRIGRLQWFDPVSDE